MHSKMSSAKWRPFCPRGDQLIKSYCILLDIIAYPCHIYIILAQERGMLLCLVHLICTCQHKSSWYMQMVWHQMGARTSAETMLICDYSYKWVYITQHIVLQPFYTVWDSGESEQSVGFNTYINVMYHNNLSNQWHIDCLFNKLFRKTAKKLSSFTLLAVLSGESISQYWIPSQSSRNTESISMACLHNDMSLSVSCQLMTWWHTEILTYLNIVGSAEEVVMCASPQTSINQFCQPF